jgi:hypothetical protein
LNKKYNSCTNRFCFGHECPGFGHYSLHITLV